MQGEIGEFAEDLGGGYVLLGAGELDDVFERLAQLLFALEGEDVEVGVEVVDIEFMAGVVVEGRHAQASKNWR
jgi:hypothetical protein